MVINKNILIPTELFGEFDAKKPVTITSEEDLIVGESVMWSCKDTPEGLREGLAEVIAEGEEPGKYLVKQIWS